MSTHRSHRLSNEELSDSTITSWVHSTLSCDPRFDRSNIQVDTSNRVVTLSGNVNNLPAEQYAILEVEKIRGVRGIANWITVRPSNQPDADIVRILRSRILDSAIIETQTIIVSSCNGEVTLAGFADNRAEAQEAVLLASEVRGVRTMKDQIQSIRPRVRHSDVTIRKDAINSLRNDVYLTGLPIVVSASGGVVCLSGGVNTAYERDRATDVVRWLPQINRVDNRIKIPWSEQPRLPSTDLINGTDDALTRAIKLKLSNDTRIEADAVLAVASRGHVVLSGAVPSLAQKCVAEKDTRDIVGVTGVSNQLSVSPVGLEEPALRSAILLAITGDPWLGGKDIGVSVDGGIATLSGTVNTLFERYHALHAATRVYGVAVIIDNLNVSWSQKRSSLDLRRSIRRRLWTNQTTFRVTNSIDLAVIDGFVKLTGHVDLWSQRVEAGRAAFDTRGVQRIDNRLTVNGYDYTGANGHLDDSDDSDEDDLRSSAYHYYIDDCLRVARGSSTAV